MANRDRAILSSKPPSAACRYEEHGQGRPTQVRRSTEESSWNGGRMGGDILRSGSIIVFVLLLEPLHRVIVDRRLLPLSYRFGLCSASCSDKRFEDLSAARDSRARLLALGYERGHPGTKQGGPVSQDLDGVECTCGVLGGCVEPVLIAAEFLAHEDPCGHPRDHVEHIRRGFDLDPVYGTWVRIQGLACRALRGHARADLPVVDSPNFLDNARDASSDNGFVSLSASSRDS